MESGVRVELGLEGRLTVLPLTVLGDETSGQTQIEQAEGTASSSSIRDSYDVRREEECLAVHPKTPDEADDIVSDVG